MFIRYETAPIGWRNRKKRKWLFNQQRGRCFWCGQPMKKPGCHLSLRMRMATKDHLVPLSKGGKNSLSNLVIACYECNSRRGNRSAIQTIEWLKEKKYGKDMSKMQ